METYELHQKGIHFQSLQSEHLYCIKKIKELIVKGTNVRILARRGTKVVTKKVLAQILFLNHSVTDNEKYGYVKKRSVESLHDEIRVLSPFEEKYLKHYKNYDQTKKYINPHNVTILD